MISRKNLWRQKNSNINIIQPNQSTKIHPKNQNTKIAILTIIALTISLIFAGLIIFQKTKTTKIVTKNNKRPTLNKFIQQWNHKLSNYHNPNSKLAKSYNKIDLKLKNDLKINTNYRDLELEKSYKQLNSEMNEYYAANKINKTKNQPEDDIKCYRILFESKYIENGMLVTKNDRVSRLSFFIQSIDLSNDDWNEILIKIPNYNGSISDHTIKQMRAIILGCGRSISATAIGFPDEKIANAYKYMEIESLKYGIATYKNESSQITTNLTLGSIIIDFAD